jgi:protein-S-isoprenylcysteine O-methyltransferase Ste14
MFGFPLTVFLASSALGLSLFEEQFMLYMNMFGMPLGSIITFAGILLIMIGWREIYRSKDKLVVTGVYRYVRHPQYLGILLVAGGWIVHWPTIPGLAMYPVLVVLYHRLARREDRWLESRYGDGFREYSGTTPSLLPRPF